MCPIGFPRRLALAGLTGLALLAAPIHLSAQAIVTYTFGPTASPTTGSSFSDPNIAASVFSGHIGAPGTSSSSPLSNNVGGSGGAYFSSSGWTTGSGNYFQFTLTPAAGYQVAVTGFSFNYKSSATGPTSFALTSSLDGYASSLAPLSLTANATWFNSGPLSIVANFTSPVTFRLTASGAGGGSGTFGVDDVTVRGSVSTVPEPATVAGVLGGTAAVLAAARRWRRTRG